MAVQFSLPRRSVIGENALESCESAMRGFGKKALIVTGKIVSKTQTFSRLTGLLEKWGTGYAVFDGITGEPTVQMIEAGVSAYGAQRCDFLIAIGGGSPLDSAKAIAAMSVLGGNISDYMGKEIEGKFPPMVLIPTTAGTGSEVTKFTIITDTEKNIKMLLKGDALLPDLAVVDPLFTLSAPKGITAATGMDALTHAVEAYTSRRANALTDPYALDAVGRIFKSLPAAFEDGNNLAARTDMALAAYEAGICINNSSVTLVHGMSRPIGALFHVPHGISNAMLIAGCLDYVQDGCYERFAHLARVIGAARPQTDDKAASQSFIEALKDLCKKVEIPTLSEYGIQKEDFDLVKEKMANDAMASGSPLNTIKVVAQADLLRIYDRLW